MVTRIKGQTVILCKKTLIEYDDFGNPVYEETEIPVENVLISPTGDNEIVSETQIYGKHSVYTLCIPKGDDNDWFNVRIKFFGSEWQSFGDVIEYQEELLPLDWNKKVKVERYG